MQIRPQGIRNYITPTGRDPYRQWHAQIKDGRTRAIITTRIERLQHGNPGDFRRLNKDLYELRIDYGPGYRVYFGRFHDFIILLGGGTKRTQQRDITRSQNYWNDFLERIKE
ncbi:MAG: type II toxin-antitoxin system RelE/ParE family toxin [Candidatus Poribacteria bacterium]|nr:type II toxin-antitoxin system RelE/ParE family toxin [Candidatus Poribacteria bacterium]